MAWVRIDDTFWSNPKLQRLSDRAFRLWMRSLGYCNQHLTDGVLDDVALRTLGATTKVCDELVVAGCFDPVPDGGYAIHDYLHFQESRETILARRRRAAERKAAQRGKANQHPATGGFT